MCWGDHQELWSPDHSVKLVVHKSHAVLVRKGKKVGPTFTANMFGDEIVWSQDSRALIWTVACCVGGQGPYHVDVFFVGKSSAPPTLEGIDETIRSDFSARHRTAECTEAEDINVMGLTWLQGSRRAVFLAQIPGTYGRCGPKAGYYEAYVFAIPEVKIVERLSQAATIKRFRSVLPKGFLEIE